nr:DEAD (Asp-Glu-Ala-Asp) box polypeptide 54 [Cryptomonas curvata]
MCCFHRYYKLNILKPFKWISILLIEYLKKKKKNKIFFRYTNQKFKKKKLRFMIKNYSFFQLEKLIKITRKHQLLIQEIRMVIYDLYFRLIMKKKDIKILTAIKDRYNVYIHLKIGKGKIIMMLLIFLDNSWTQRKNFSKIMLFNSIVLISSGNKEYVNQVLKLNLKINFIFNFFITTRQFFSTIKKSRGYGLFIFYLYNDKNSNSITVSFLKKTKHVIIDQSELENIKKNIIVIKRMLLFFFKKKFQLIYIKSKYASNTQQIKHNCISIDLRLKRMHKLGSNYSLYVFNKSLSKISKLLYYLEKENRKCVIFLNSKKRCNLLKKIIKKYFKVFEKFSFQRFSEIEEQIMLTNNNEMKVGNKFSNIKCTINYDVPNNIMIYSDRLDCIDNRNYKKIFFFLTHEIKIYKNFIRAVFAITTV